MRHSINRRELVAGDQGAPLGELMLVARTSRGQPVDLGADLSDIDRVLVDGTRLLGRDLAPFVTPHGLKSGPDDLVGAFTSRSAQPQEQVAGADVDLDGAGVV